MAQIISIFEACSANIWNFKQNHPELVIKDCAKYGAMTAYQLSVVRQSMLCRGINKWLKVRRDLIAYKKMVKHQIVDLMQQVGDLKTELSACYCHTGQVLSEDKTIYDFDHYTIIRTRYLIAKEKLKTLQKVRATLRGLCNTDRWQIWQGKRIEEMNTLKASDR